MSNTPDLSLITSKYVQLIQLVRSQVMQDLEKENMAVISYHFVFFSCVRALRRARLVV